MIAYQEMLRGQTNTMPFNSLASKLCQNKQKHSLHGRGTILEKETPSCVYVPASPINNLEIDYTQSLDIEGWLMGEQ